jgi:phospholipid/cholesterol/gamma-HCH transport system substrate-binding protein
METRANHLLIGIFMLVLVGAALVFVLWLARFTGDREFAFYDIYFTDSVAGLGIGGDVRFNGIKVGEVAEIDIDHENPNRVRVLVRINVDTPIRIDSYATLQLQGITGLSFVQITGGTRTAALLAYKRGEPPPQIQSRPSQIAQLLERAPELLLKGTELMERATEIVGPENQRLVTQILSDIATLTGQIAALGPEIQRVVKNADQSAGDFAAAAQSLRTATQRVDRVAAEAEKTLLAARDTIGGVNKLVRTEVTQAVREAQSTIAEFRATARSFNSAAGTIDALETENRGPIDEFMNDGLAQMTRFLSDARQLMASLNRLANRLEEDPSRVLFGDKAPERQRE